LWVLERLREVLGKIKFRERRETIYPIAKGQVNVKRKTEPLVDQVLEDWLGDKESTRMSGQVPETLAKEGLARKPRITTTFDRKKLVEIWHTDGPTFRIVNLWPILIMAGGYFLDHEDEEVSDRFMEWCRRVELDEVLEAMIKDNWLYGWAIARIHRDEDGLPVYLEVLNPDDWEVEKDGLGRMILDDKGRPVRFKKKRSLSGTDVLPVEDAFYFSFFTLGRDPVGVSPIETIYPDYTINDNIKHAIGELYFRAGTNINVIYVGDADTHEPTSEEMEKVAEDLSDIDDRTFVVFPYWYRYERVGAEIPPNIQRAAEFFEEVKAATLGIPRSLIMRADARGEYLREQLNILQREIVRYQNKISRAIEDQLFRDLADRWNVTPPRIKWIQVSPRDQLERARRLGIYFRWGAITRDVRTENFIRKEEGLPLLSEEESSLEDRVKSLERRLRELEEKVG